MVFFGLVGAFLGAGAVFGVAAVATNNRRETEKLPQPPTPNRLEET
jgi:hypothetical protein